MDTNKIHIIWPEYFGCSDIILKASYAQYIDSNNYGWSGENRTDTNLYCNLAFFDIIRNNGKYAGALQLDSSYWVIMNLNDTLQLIALQENMLFLDSNSSFCESYTNTGWPPPPPNDPEGCYKNITKALVIYTEGALSAKPDLIELIKLGLQQTNLSLSNTPTDEIIYLSVIVQCPFNWSYDEYISADANFFNFYSRSDIQQLRTDYNADLVYFVTETNIPNTAGMVLQNGVNTFNAIAWLSAYYLKSAVKVMAHETGHFYGGFHNKEINSQATEQIRIESEGHRGNQFYYESKRYWTSVSFQPKSGRVIPYYSNPNQIWKRSQETGESDRNNFEAIEEFKLRIRAFKPDPKDFYVGISLENPEDCELTGIAYAQGLCGTPNYSYSWQISYDGYTWLSAGTGNSLNFSHLVPPNDESVSKLFIKLIGTDANNFSDEAIRISTAICRGPLWILIPEN